MRSPIRLVIWLVAVLVCLPGHGRSELYEYTDANGTVHFSDKPPLVHQKTVRRNGFGDSPGGRFDDPHRDERDPKTGKVAKPPSQTAELVDNCLSKTDVPLKTSSGDRMSCGMPNADGVRPHAYNVRLKNVCGGNAIHCKFCPNGNENYFCRQIKLEPAEEKLFEHQLCSSQEPTWKCFRDWAKTEHEGPHCDGAAQSCATQRW